jgi:hypothetical protein
MTPSGLKQITSLDRFTPIYLPYWTFDSVTTADWKAEVGHTETERYFQNGEWKTRTKTVWRWERGHVRLPFDDVIVAGTTRLSKLLLGRLKNFNLAELCPYEPKFLAGIEAQAYDVPLETAWETGREEMRAATRQACIEQASTSQIRNFSMEMDFAEESWRYILLPVYLASYPYESKTYQVIVDGQNGVVSGQRPIAWNKVWLAIAAALTPGLLIGLIGLLTIVFGGVGIPIAFIGLVVLLIGLAVSIYIFRQADSLDDA